MEAPIPIIETKINDKNNEIIRPKDIKTYKFKSDKSIEFEIQFYIYRENIIFEALIKDILLQKKV